MDKYLYYIEGNIAFFTDTLEDEWEDNIADDRYEQLETNEQSIDMISFDSHIDIPVEDIKLNSNFYIEDINDRQTPLLSGRSMITGENIEIYSGITMDEFINKIIEAGGKVYYELES